MVSLSQRPAVAVELTVVLCQVIGLAMLALACLLRHTRFALPCRVVFILALIGLGLTSSLCSQYDSKFALFGGATLGFFLIGTCWVQAHPDAIDTLSHTFGPEF
jgi:hypothetical protein